MLHLKDLEKAIPTSLDTVIKKNRDAARLRQASNVEIEKLMSEVDPHSPTRHTLSDWHLIAFDVDMRKEGQTEPDWYTRIHLVGWNEFDQSWITSDVKKSTFKTG